MKFRRSSKTVRRWLLLSAIALAFFSISTRAPLAQRPVREIPRELRDGDLDRDGLLDSSESSLGCNPRKANLILVPVLRPNVTRAQVETTLRKVTEFFARVPNRNPDGSTGIAVVIHWGNPLPAADRESSSPCCPGDPCTATDYHEVRSRGMPTDMIGKGHGVLIGSCANGGGQEGGPDWAGVSNSWHVIAHEVGHQLGLQHEPRETGIPSPLYASVMNYDYMYQFRGDSNAVQFSTGKFSSVRLDETNLSETLPFAIGDLRFLEQDPYRFRLQESGARATNVDFNRNGTFGERGLRVEINGGSGLTARDRLDLAQTAGGFTLAAIGDHLVAVYSALSTPPDWGRYTSAGLSTSNPGLLRYQVLSGDRLSAPRTLVDRSSARDPSSGVTGDPHAIEAFGKLFLTFPTPGGYAVHAYRIAPADGRLTLVGFALENSAPSSQPVLVRTTRPDELNVFIWNERTRRVSYRKVTTSPTANVITLGPAADLNMGFGSVATRLESTSPVGVAWNSKIERIALVSAEPNSDFRGRMKLIHLGRIEAGWYGQNQRWVGGNAGNPVPTLSRPTILFDDRPRAGATGQYLIYSLWERTGSNSEVTKAMRLTFGGSGEAWGDQLMMNIWTTSRSAPSATLYRDDVAWGWRVDEMRFPAVPNILQLFLRASGITDSGITDFDDVTWISTRGLAESLRNAPR